MKRLWRVFGVVVLGITFLTGCGDGEKGVALNGQPIASNEIGQKETDERITLTLGTLGTDRRIQSAVESYNALGEKYYVEIVNYLPEQYDSAVREASLDRLRMALATSREIDIVAFNGLVADELGYAGVLADLNNFLTSQDKQEKYLGNILECSQTGDSLYAISPAFTLEFIAGDGSRLGMGNGWNLEEMMKSFEINGQGGSALGKGGVRIVSRLVEYSIEDYVDWDTGKVNFVNEEFYRILEFGKEADNGKFVRPTRESVASGNHLASCEILAQAADIQKLNWLFGENMVVKGYPCVHGTGVAVNMEDGALGISAYSQCPEGAWNFLNFYVGATWTELEFYAEDILIKERFSDIFPGFPLNRELFEQELEHSMVQQYTDAGEPLPMIWGEGDAPNFFANTAEDVEKLREIIALADRRKFSSQSVISQIIEDEISGYKTGGVSAEQTAKTIQNRIQLYLDEQKR